MINSDEVKHEPHRSVAHIIKVQANVVLPTRAKSQIQLMEAEETRLSVVVVSSAAQTVWAAAAQMFVVVRKAACGLLFMVQVLISAGPRGMLSSLVPWLMLLLCVAH